MSYTLTIGCGCLVYVASHPRTKIVHTRIIERRGGDCRVRAHDIGVRPQLWELLPDPDLLDVDDHVRAFEGVDTPAECR